MVKKKRFAFIVFGVIVLTILFLFYLTRTAAFQSAPNTYTIAIILDLIITIPVFYFYLIRKTETPRFTVIYTILFGILIASFIIPAEQQGIVSTFKKFIIPILELIILSVLIYKVYALRKNYVETQQTKFDFYTNIMNAANSIFPGKLGKIMATEISVFYYLFASNKSKLNDENSFTYYKKSGIKSVVYVLLFILLAETIVVHLFVDKWNSHFAWVLSFLGVYTMIQIFSILRSLDKRLIEIDYDSRKLNLRYGFANQTTIPFDQLLKIEKNRNYKGEHHVSLSLFDLLETPNVVLHLKEKQTLQKLYGFEKTYESISFFVDEKELFIYKMKDIIGQDAHSK